VHFPPLLITGKIPLMILNSDTLFPNEILSLHIFEPCYRRILSDVLESHRMFESQCVSPGPPGGSHAGGGLGLVRVCVGAARYRPYRVERVELLYSIGEEATEVSGLWDRLLTMVKDRFDLRMGAELPSALPGMMLQSPLG